MACLVAPHVAKLMDFHPYAAFSEYRPLAKFPYPQYVDLDDYPGAFDTFYNDHFGFRKAFAVKFAQYRYQLFGSVADKRYTTYDGQFLYYRDLYGQKDFPNRTWTPLERRAFAICMEERHQCLTEMGICFVLAVIPAKSSISPRIFEIVDTNSHASQLLHELVQRDSGVNAVDLTPKFSAIGEFSKLYYRSDTHWKYEGAYVGYEIIMNAIAKDIDLKETQPIPLFRYPSERVTKNNGNIGRLLGFPIEEDVVNYDWDSEDYTIVRRDSYNSHVITKHRNQSLPSLLSLNDSYIRGDSSIPETWMLFARHFSRARFIDSWRRVTGERQFPVEIVREFRPSVVLMAINEDRINGRIDHGNDVHLSRKNSPIVRQSRLRTLWDQARPINDQLSDLGGEVVLAKASITDSDKRTVNLQSSLRDHYSRIQHPLSLEVQTIELDPSMREAILVMGLSKDQATITGVSASANLEVDYRLIAFNKL